MGAQSSDESLEDRICTHMLLVRANTRLLRLDILVRRVCKDKQHALFLRVQSSEIDIFGGRSRATILTQSEENSFNIYLSFARFFSVNNFLEGISQYLHSNHCE